ncbi:unnamed protein product [Boreogadus saida]
MIEQPELGDCQESSRKERVLTKAVQCYCTVSLSVQEKCRTTDAGAVQHSQKGCISLPIHYSQVLGRTNVTASVHSLFTWPQFMA